MSVRSVSAPTFGVPGAQPITTPTPHASAFRNPKDFYDHVHAKASSGRIARAARMGTVGLIKESPSSSSTSFFSILKWNNTHTQLAIVIVLALLVLAYLIVNAVFQKRRDAGHRGTGQTSSVEHTHVHDRPHGGSTHQPDTCCRHHRRQRRPAWGGDGERDMAQDATTARTAPAWSLAGTGWMCSTRTRGSY